MGDVDAAAIAVADREGRARDPLLHAERAARAPDERRLARAEVARDGHDVADLELFGKPPCELLGLGRRARLGQNRPSCTAGSTTAGATSTGSGGAASRPISSGRRKKS